jgi:prepilin-type processing-associated H-X9-DG protein
MAVRYPDGTATVLLCDGSVQSVTAARAAELPR